MSIHLVQVPGLPSCSFGPHRQWEVLPKGSQNSESLKSMLRSLSVQGILSGGGGREVNQMLKYPLHAPLGPQKRQWGDAILPLHWASAGGGRPMYSPQHVVWCVKSDGVAFLTKTWSQQVLHSHDSSREKPTGRETTQEGKGCIPPL